MSRSRTSRAVLALLVAAAVTSGSAVGAQAVAAAPRQSPSLHPSAGAPPWTPTVRYLVGPAHGRREDLAGARQRSGRGSPTPSTPTDPGANGAIGVVSGVPRLGIPTFRHVDSNGVNLFADSTAYPGRLGVAASFDPAGGRRVRDGGRSRRPGTGRRPDLRAAGRPDPAADLGAEPHHLRRGSLPDLPAGHRRRPRDPAAAGCWPSSSISRSTTGRTRTSPSVVDERAAHELYLGAYEARADRRRGQLGDVLLRQLPDRRCPADPGVRLREPLRHAGRAARPVRVHRLDRLRLRRVARHLRPARWAGPGVPQHQPRRGGAQAAGRPVVGDVRPGLRQGPGPGRRPHSVPVPAVRPARRRRLPGAGRRPMSARRPRPRPSTSRPAIALARRLAEESAVLLKNDDHVLPLPRRGGSVAVIGPTADVLPAAPGTERSRGVGQRTTISPLDVLRAELGTSDQLRARNRPGRHRPSPPRRSAPPRAGPPGSPAPPPHRTGPCVGTQVDAAAGRQPDRPGQGQHLHLDRLCERAVRRHLDPLAATAGRNPGGQPLRPERRGQPRLPGRAVHRRVRLRLPDRGRYRGAAHVGLHAASERLQGWTDAERPIPRADHGRGTGDADAGRAPDQVRYATSAKAATAPTMRLSWAPQKHDVDAAVAAAARAHTAVVFVDDANTNVPAGEVGTLGPDQDDLIEKIAAANPNTVVVLNTGAGVLMPWLARVKGVLEMWFPGQEGGTATANLLLGNANPSGRLPITFPADNASTPFAGHPERATGVNGQIVWSEGLQMGYRWYLANHVQPLFPFGFGLSYSSFAYSGLKVHGPHGHSGVVKVSFRVRNTGPVTGDRRAPAVPEPARRSCRAVTAAGRLPPGHPQARPLPHDQAPHRPSQHPTPTVVLGHRHPHTGASRPGPSRSLSQRPSPTPGSPAASSGTSASIRPRSDNGGGRPHDGRLVHAPAPEQR